MLLSAIVVAAIGVVAITAVLSEADGFPDSLLGFERVHGGDADAAEAGMESVQIGEVDIRTAVYGTADRPKIVVSVFDNLPTGDVDLESMMQGAIAGAETSGGSVAERSRQDAEAGGSRFACARALGQGFLFPGGPLERGVVCVFTGESVGTLVTTHTTVPVIGLQAVRAFADSYDA